MQRKKKNYVIYGIFHRVFSIKKQNYNSGLMKRFLLIFLIFINPIIHLSAQDKFITVSGKVSDTSIDEELIGVTIVEKGSINCTMTDIDGKYSIKVHESSILEFSYIGYITKEVIAESNTINTSLEEYPKYMNCCGDYICLPRKKPILDVGVEKLLLEVREKDMKRYNIKNKIN